MLRSLRNRVLAGMGLLLLLVFALAALGIAACGETLQHPDGTLRPGLGVRGAMKRAGQTSGAHSGLITQGR